MQPALVIARGPKPKIPLSGLVAWAVHMPLARLQSKRMATRPSASRVMV
jgi:hypothetical protein